jgi:hypothetical protein
VSCLTWGGRPPYKVRAAWAMAFTAAYLWLLGHDSKGVSAGSPLPSLLACLAVLASAPRSRRERAARCAPYASRMVREGEGSSREAVCIVRAVGLRIRPG